MREKTIRSSLLAALALGLAACGGEDAPTASTGSTPPANAPPANRAPVIGGTPASKVIAGQVYIFSPVATDPDGDTIQFGADGLPGWLSIVPATGKITGTPEPRDVGEHRGIVVWVTDGRIQTKLSPLDIEVLPTRAMTNRSPEISGTPVDSVQVGRAYDFLPVVSDVDGDVLSFEIEHLPDWANFDPAIGRLHGTPDSGRIGTYPGIMIRVSDGIATATVGPFAIIVNPEPTQNRAPVIAGSPDPTVLVGQTWSFQPQAADPDGSPLQFQVFGAPAWMSFDPHTGALSGTPVDTDVGIHSGIQIVVTDGEASATLPPFAIEVVSPNLPPAISGSPAGTALVGSFYSFAPTASDPDSDELVFSVTGLPPWASFDNVTGQLSGTPASTGTFASIVISVSDGQESAVLPAFAVEVVEPRPPPVISGNPAAAALAGSPYSFTPTTGTSGSDPLTFAVFGLPAWATFDYTTGTIAGTPGTSDVGVHAGISIAVSDGYASAVLGPFTIQVQNSATGTALLAWLPPVENTDGTALVDLAGYTIYWGLSSGNYTSSIRLSNAGLATYLVENLLPGHTYYFAMTAFSAEAVESDYSNEVSKTIP